MKKSLPTFWRAKVATARTSSLLAVAFFLFGILQAQTTFNYTGGVQTYTVPTGVTSLTVDVQGAAGGLSTDPLIGPGGNGGRVTGTINVSPGQVLNVYVGGAGGNGTTSAAGVGGFNGGAVGGVSVGNYSGGGGGGASDIRVSPYGLGNRLVVAGGGGGGAYNYSTPGWDRGGMGGGLTGENGYGGNANAGQGAGLGGSQSLGGTAGTYPSYCTGTNGSLGLGGAGGTCTNTGGGGGGGYYGGGGGVWSGGGGGSSFLTGGVHTQGFRAGNGLIVITPNATTAPCATPSNVTANPMMVCPGSTANLNATSAGNFIDWYTTPTGGTSLGQSASGANFAVTPLGTTTYYAEAIGSSVGGSQTFSYTGAAQTFTVPTGVTSLTVDISGAKGGDGFPIMSYGGAGGRVQGSITVTSGQVLQINVGGVGGNGSSLAGGTGGFNGGAVGGLYSGSYSGGGGGGASDIRTTPYALANRLVVAGGGGGAAFDYSTPNYENGGVGGGLIGGTGYHGNIIGENGYPGTGGTQSAGGTAGFFSGYCGATNGALGIGGAGGPCTNSGGGGGGGYYGGGGGVWGGGGGGSSFIPVGTHTQAFQTGNGSVTLSWTGTGGCSSSQRVPVTVTVDNVAPTAVCQAVTVTLDANGNGSTTAAAVGSGSTDNCSVASSSLSQSTFTCSNAGATTVILTVTDGNGNTATCAAVVTVVAPAVTGTLSALTTNCGYNVSCPGGNDGIATAVGGGGCPGYTYQWSNGATSPTNGNLVAGVYTVTITDGAGGTVVESITITEPSALQVASSTTSTCANGTTGAIDITATGGNDCTTGYTYLWSNGATTEDLSGLSAGTYSVTVTDPAGCTRVENITVNALPAPIAAFTVTGNVLTSTQTWATYQWLLNGNNISGANAMSYTATQSGSYNLIVTDSNGCEGVSNATNVTLVGIDNALSMGLSIYPNPAHSEFRLRTANPIGYGLTVSIHDMFGKRLFAQTMPELGHEVAFDLKDFAAGTYMIEVVSELGQRQVFRLVVQ